MTVQLIAYPFRLADDGRVETHEQDSEAYIAERIALILACRPGERPLVPAFGIDDPTYGNITMSALQNQMLLFGLPVQIDDVTRFDVDEANTNFTVSFQINEEQDL